MADLNEYLAQKRIAALAKKQEAREKPEPTQFKAQVRALGRSGIREIRIRNFQIISDSQPDFAGYDLGPASPELQLGVLGSCLTHITLIQAALRGVQLNSLEVEVTGQQHPLAQQEGYEDIPIYPHNIRYKLRIGSPAPAETIAELHQAVEKICPILNLLAKPQKIEGDVILNGADFDRDATTPVE